MNNPDKNQKYLIQGIFFQDFQQLGIAQLSEVEGGAQVVVRGGLYQFMFHGIIFPHPIFALQLVGEMSDRFGDSELTDVSITRKKNYFFQEIRS